MREKSKDTEIPEFLLRCVDFKISVIVDWQWIDLYLELVVKPLYLPNCPVLKAILNRVRKFSCGDSLQVNGLEEICTNEICPTTQVVVVLHGLLDGERDRLAFYAFPYDRSANYTSG
jgi:hypothetical protein